MRQTATQVLALTTNKENSPLLKLLTAKSFFLIICLALVDCIKKASTFMKNK
jgi:hypothetical protein